VNRPFHTRGESTRNRCRLGTFRLPSRDAWVSANTTVSHKWLNNVVTYSRREIIDFSVFPVLFCFSLLCISSNLEQAVEIQIFMPSLQKMIE
jgi:hypothetical protein